MEPGSAFARWLFLAPEARVRIVNWADFAAPAVRALRTRWGATPTIVTWPALVEELRGADADVAQWWDDQRVTFRTSATEHVAHPTAGPLTFGIETLVGPHDPEQRLVVYTVEPDSPTARVLPMLASWSGVPQELSREDETI